MKRVTLPADAGVSAGVLIRLLVPVLCLWMALACAMPPAEVDAEPTAVPVEEVSAPDEPTDPEPDLEEPAAATIRTGPSTEYDPAFWVNADTELTVLSRNADGTWLEVAHDGRAGWIHASLTDVAADVLAGLPVTAAAPVVEAAAEDAVAAPQPAQPEPVAEPWITGWSVPARILVRRQGGADAINIAPSLDTPHRIACVQGGAPVVDHPAYARVSLKVVHLPDEAERMVRLWARIFKGTVSTTQAAVCRDGTALAPFTLRLRHHRAGLHRRGHRHPRSLS